MSEYVTDNAVSIRYTVETVRDFLIEETFKAPSVYVSNTSRRNAEKLAILVYLDHAGIEHDALATQGIKDMGTFIMNALASCFMKNTMTVTGYTAHSTVIPLVQSPAEDLRVLNNGALSSAPFFTSLGDIRSMYMRVQASVTANMPTIKKEKHPALFIKQQLQDALNSTASN